MKKLFFSLLSASLLLIVGQSFAISNTDLFAVDEVSIEETFAPLDKLEEIVTANPTADLNFLQQYHTADLQAVNLLNEAMSLAAPMEDRPAAGISGYIWGACLGGLGIILVYILLDEASKEYRKKETLHAVVGCVASVAILTVVSIAAGSSFLWL